MDEPRTNADPARARRIELILQQLDTLPTLSPIAVRLLELTETEDFDAQEVIRLVASDPSLASKVLKLCRCSQRGRAANVSSVERAVLLMGFDAVRTAVLSVQVFEALDGVTSPGGEKLPDDPIFRRELFWQHSLAVSVTAEVLAADAVHASVDPSEAVLAGLLHDLGMLALHVVLPRSFDQICRLADTYGLTVDQACRRVIGIDSHTAGKRLAEHWRLPRALVDVMWLHGQRLEMLPDLAHRDLIALVSLADVIARRSLVTPAGHGPRGESLGTWREHLQLSRKRLERVEAMLPEQVDERVKALGVEVEHDVGALVRSLGRANETLGRANTQLRQRAILAERQAATLQAITRFHDDAGPVQSVVDVLGHVVRSAARVLQGRFFLMLYQSGSSPCWQIIQFSPEGQILRNDVIDPPADLDDVEDLIDQPQASMRLVGLLPWLASHLPAEARAQLQLLPLRCGWGASGLLLHDCPVDRNRGRVQIDALSRTWAAAITAAAQNEDARRLGEQLAESNRVLTETQHELARRRAMASLGEIAAGAAHEMNNPLCVISGRSQILSTIIEDERMRSMAQQIAEQSHRLSDMITALRSLAEPITPDRRRTEVAELLTRAVDLAHQRLPGERVIKTVVEPGLPALCVDPEHLAEAVAELLRNGAEAQGSTVVELRVQIDGFDDRLILQVRDDGEGLSEHALAHAFDPFFSAKPAGRQPGLGLARARRLVEAHGGRIALNNGPDHGAVATIWLHHWRAEEPTCDVA